MFQEDFIAQQWLNSIFSELENYELVQNPTEEGFFWPMATLKKRDWLYTEVGVGGVYNRKTDWDIQGKIVVWWVAFFWDDECKVYRFEKIAWDFIMTKVYNDDDTLTFKDTDMYWNKIKQKSICIPYLSEFVNSWTADSVLSTNDDWSWNVRLVVNEVWIFDTTSVWQYIYFTNSASNKAKYQIRQIVEYIDEKTVYLSEQFYADPSTWEVNETWETYELIDQVVVFNNLRDANNLTLCISLSTNEITFRNLGGNDIEIFEGRYRYINAYWSSVGWSFATGEYELLDPDTVLWSSIDGRWQKMNSLVLTKNYLMVNQETSISVVRKIAATSTSLPIYNLNWVINWDSSFSPESIFYKWWLYYVGLDTLLQWWDIVAVSTNLIYGETKNQWKIIQRYLNEIQPDTYVTAYDFGRWPVIQYVNDWKTTMLVYDNIYQWWLPWKYNMAIYDKFEMFYGELLIGVWNKICFKRWTDDLWEDIKVKCVVTWSKNFVNSLFSLKKIKLSLWYYKNVVKFKIRLDLWYAVFEGKVEKDANGVEYLVWQNIAWSWSWLWYVPIGFNTIGWWNSLDDYIAKIWLIWIPIWKKCSYYKLTLENIDNYDLNIVGISVLTEWGSPYITPSVNVF